MRTARLENMVKGWFVGNFEPSMIKTNDVEVAVKIYHKGDWEEPHYHKIATELTVVVQGKIKMFDRIFSANDIIVVEPGECTGFEALEDTINVVVKYPGANHDKYLPKEEA